MEGLKLVAYAGCAGINEKTLLPFNIILSTLLLSFILEVWVKLHVNQSGSLELFVTNIERTYKY